MYVIVVSMRVRPGRVAEFEEAMAANAAASVRDEPGCLRFDVLRDSTDPCRYLLYEVYADEDAFQTAHLGSPHFAAWQAVAPQVLAEDGVSRRSYTPVRAAA